MAALDFPASPTTNQQWNAPNGVTYTFDGAVWTNGGPASGQSAGGDLSGSYPNPTVVKSAGNFTVGGQAIIPGPASGDDLVWGTRTAKGRLSAMPSQDTVGWRFNATTGGSAPDDATNPAWAMQADPGDVFDLWHSPPGASLAWSLLMQLAGTGKLTIPGPTASGSGADQSPLVTGTRTIKTRLIQLPNQEWYALALNSRYDGSNFYADDSSKAGWLANCELGSDSWFIYRAPPTAGAQTYVNFFQVRSDGRVLCNLADTSVGINHLVHGATVNNMTAVTFPSWTNVTTGTWLRVVDTPAITLRGGTTVLVWAFPAGSYSVNPTGGYCYSGLGVDYGTANLGYTWYRLQGSGGGANDRPPIPTLLLYWQNAAGGSHVFSYWVNQGTNCLALIENGGLLVAMEFS